MSRDKLEIRRVVLSYLKISMPERYSTKEMGRGLMRVFTEDTPYSYCRHRRKNPNPESVEGLVHSIRRYMIHDGPGIRTVVFMKGCPLRCSWCSSPHTWSSSVEVALVNSKCILCNSCMEVCPENAITHGKGHIEIDRIRCTNCGQCVRVCPSGALRFNGYWTTVEAAMKVIERDTKFYQASGGGVTVSGGEPTLQAEFVTALLEACKDRGIHTASETSAFVQWKTLKHVAHSVALLLLDIKHMDTEEHRRFTGYGNKLILDNIGRLAQTRADSIIVRFPVIPGYNDSVKNINELLRFMRSLRLHKIDIFPFHKLGVHEYEELGLRYKTEDIQPPTTSQMLRIKRLIEAKGFGVTA